MGGLGIKDLKLQNIDLGAKLVWKFIKNPNATWVRMLETNYLLDQDHLNILRIGNFSKGSRTWNFIISCRNLVSESITWDIHDGSSSIFWEDSWGGYPPMAKSINIPTIEYWFKQHWASRVRDYLEMDDSSNSQSWRWKSMEGLPIPREDLDQLLEHLEARNISP